MVGFVMIPFYTHHLNPADYGTLELLDLSLTLTTLVLTMWLNASLVRQYNDFRETQDRNEAVSTILIFATLIGLVVGACGMFFSHPLSSLILKTPDLHFYITLEALSFMVSSVSVVCLSYLRARQRSALVVAVGLVGTVLSLLLNIYFIAFQHSGAVGVLYSSLISGVLIGGVLAGYTVRQVGISFSYSKLKGIIAFGAPLIVTSAAAFTVNFSDRFFLREFATISTVGIYALGYKFGFMISLLIVQPFDMIWHARIYKIAEQENSPQVFARLFEYYCFVLVTVALGLSIGIKELLSWISTAEFHAAYKVVPIVALAYIFQGTNRFFLAGTYIAKKTMRLGPVGLASAAANIGLNFLLIPRYGMMGAAWATAISFMFMSVLAFTVSQRVYRIPYTFARVVPLLVMATVIYLASGLVTLPSIALQLAAKLAIFAAFPIALYLFSFFSEAEVEKGKTLTQTILYRYRLLSPAESE
jgi:O-antigen/teichoic acid export membrane protein